MLHVADMARQGFKRVLIKSVDTDVPVLAVAAFHRVTLQELWFAFGTGKNLRYIAVHSIASSLDKQSHKLFQYFMHLLVVTRHQQSVDEVKKSAWETWKCYPDVTSSFIDLSITPTNELITANMPTIERFVVLYDRTSTENRVNDARKCLFTQKAQSMECIPPNPQLPSQSIQKEQPIKLVTFGARHLFKLLPAEWGWVKGKDDTWEPFWSALPQAAASCQELLKCGCNPEKGCLGRCKCLKAELLCTALCKCGESCDREQMSIQIHYNVQLL